MDVIIGFGMMDAWLKDGVQVELTPAALNAAMAVETTGKPLALVDRAPGKRKYGIWVDTGQRWIRLGQRDLNPPIDCYEQLHIAWFIQVRYGDVSPEWLVEHASRQ